MSEGGSPEQSRRGQRLAVHHKRRRRWVFIGIGILVLIIGATAAYWWIKAQRADRFAAEGGALSAQGKLTEAAVQYRVALQLNPSSYRGLSGAARLATKADRPEALELWHKVLSLRQCTTRDRQDYADLLIKTNRLSLAEKVIDPLLQQNPDTRTLQLAARYSKKIGDAGKAIEYARIAIKRAPDDEASRFQLAELLAQSMDSRGQEEARQILWQIAAKSSVYKRPAVEALATAPKLTAEERNRLMQELAALTPKTIKDDLLEADLRFQLHPDDAAQIYLAEIDRWQNGKREEIVDLARWLNSHQQAELVLSTFPIERTLEDNQLLLSRLDALASLQRWNDIDDVLNRSDVTLDASVIESFHARTAQERNSTLDAEMHWNHAISLAGTDPFKLKFVANFAEQSHATAAALKAYEQLARFPDQADFAYRGTERVSQKSGETTTQRAAMAKITARTPDDPNAADQLAYLSLLLGEDVDKNFDVAKRLAEQYPSRLAYRVTVALAYLRKHDPASAIAQFKAPEPIEWKRTLPAWRAVYAAALLAADRNDEAQEILKTIPRDRLNPQERELIESAVDSKSGNN
jgi:thioredoxin-like negative regulator of GroEL